MIFETEILDVIDLMIDMMIMVVLISIMAATISNSKTTIKTLETTGTIRINSKTETTINKVQINREISSSRITKTITITTSRMEMATTSRTAITRETRTATPT